MQNKDGEMIKKAARALCVAQGYAETENEITRAAEEVRAILMAIREPSEAMLLAGEYDDCHPQGFYFGGDRLKDSWQAMIDAALSE